MKRLGGLCSLDSCIRASVSMRRLATKRESNSTLDFPVGGVRAAPAKLGEMTDCSAPGTLSR